MVYCGKPSRGCQMCRTRRIKVCRISLTTLPVNTYCLVLYMTTSNKTLTNLPLP